MGCQIAGANEIDGTITCKLTNDCIQPFLSIEAVSISLDCNPNIIILWFCC